MAKILIAYNNHHSVSEHNFFQSCSDEVRQHCVDNKHAFILLDPPNLNNQELLKNIAEVELCFIAAHGDYEGILNEENEHVISTHTINYDFKNKILYTVACYSGGELKEEMSRIGVKLFVGYKKTFRFCEDEEVLLNCAISGIHKILCGASFSEALEYMNTTFEEEIKKAKAASNYMQELILLHNKENLVFEGRMNESL